MTKLNHNRPFLRYLDNIRREMGIEARRTDTLSFKNASPSPTVGDVFPLTSSEASVAAGFLDAIENYLKVESTLIAAVKPGATKQSKAAAKLASRDRAEGMLKGAAMALSARMLLSGLEGRMNLLNLYRRLENEIKEEDYFLWEVVNDVAMHEAMQKLSALVDAHVLGSSLWADLTLFG